MLVNLPGGVGVGPWVIMSIAVMVDSVVEVGSMFALLNRCTDTITSPVITSTHAHTVIARLVYFLDFAEQREFAYVVLSCTEFVLI